MTVARGASRLVDYGLTLAYEAVEEGTLSDIGASYDSY